MKAKRSHELDQTVLISVLADLGTRGQTIVRASDLKRASAVSGHAVPKKFVRRRLTVNGDGVTPIAGVTIAQKPKETFWFSRTP